MKSIEVPPKASILIESMRDIGYSLETALADVVDNSITAGARRIHIRVDTVSPEVKLGIIDDGSGMTQHELLGAMRLGSRHPHEERQTRDLGRFGLGLKTASFSQCRRLTVVARRNGVLSAATWDLARIAADDRWTLEQPDDPSSVPFVDELPGDGVLVLWEMLDRAVEQGGSPQARQHFVKRVDEATQHLELVFHRFLAGEHGIPKVTLLLNGRQLIPFDPFHASHEATMRGQIEKVQIGQHLVTIQPFTLPHHRNVTPAEWDRHGGPAGYLKNQGFYLYREKRLIVHGTWFGLARQMELTKLTRVRIDMPNGLDTAWHVDVKKASARPPLQVRERLQQIISQLGAPSRRVFVHRGVRFRDPALSLWERRQKDNAIIYGVNPSNPMVMAFAARLSAPLQLEFSRLLAVISAGLPMDALFADLAGTPEAVSSEKLPSESLAQLVAVSADALLTKRLTPDQITEMLRVVEPFRSHWDDAEALLEEYLESRNA